jgi:hypothetical protein
MSQKTSPGGGAGSDRPAAPRNDRREAFRRGTTVDSAEEQLGRAAELDEALDTLRIRFEQYFLGVTRKPPVQERAALRSAILKLKTGFIRNTAVKFRVNMLHNRFLTYERLWDRTLREIEDGTYRRDLFKARLHRAQAEAGAAGESARLRKGAEALAAAGEAGRAAEGGEDGSSAERPAEAGTGKPEAAGGAGAGSSAQHGRGDSGAVAPEKRAAGEAGRGTSAQDATGGPGKPGAGTAGAAEKPLARPVGGTERPVSRPAGGAVAPAGGPGGAGVLDESRIRAIHAAYVKARRRCRESTEGITVEAIGAALRKQVPGLLAKHQARTVDFQVVIQNGKAVLKAIPR